MNDEASAPEGLMEQGLKDIFERILKVSDLQDGLSIENVDLWDSLTHILLMTSIEERFSIMIDPEDIIALTSVGAIRTYLKGCL